MCSTAKRLCGCKFSNYKCWEKQKLRPQLSQEANRDEQPFCRWKSSEIEKPCHSRKMGASQSTEAHGVGCNGCGIRLPPANPNFDFYKALDACGDDRVYCFWAPNESAMTTSVVKTNTATLSKSKKRVVPLRAASTAASWWIMITDLIYTNSDSGVLVEHL